LCISNSSTDESEASFISLNLKEEEVVLERDSEPSSGERNTNSPTTKTKDFADGNSIMNHKEHKQSRFG
jgi:hypothetical protein